jgi:hypothetical protein
VWDLGDLDHIVESLAVCSERDERYRAVARAGRDLYAERYTPGIIQKKFLQLVDEALA